MLATTRSQPLSSTRGGTLRRVGLLVGGCPHLTATVTSLTGRSTAPPPAIGDGERLHVAKLRRDPPTIGALDFLYWTHGCAFM